MARQTDPLKLKAVEVLVQAGWPPLDIAAVLHLKSRTSYDLVSKARERMRRAQEDLIEKEVQRRLAEARVMEGLAHRPDWSQPVSRQPGGVRIRTL